MTPFRGHIALISTMVMSFILMSFAILAGESGFYALMNTFSLENRLVAVHRARSCAAIALLHIAQDGSYDVQEGSEEMQLPGSLACFIEEAHEENGTVWVVGSAVVGGSVSRIRMDAELSSSSTITNIRWDEL